MLSPFECLCGNFILPEPASYVFFYALFNLRNLLYIICKLTAQSPAASYVPLPRFLLQDEALRDISNDAKVLYALLLDRASISRQNGYIEPDGTIRLYFTLEQAQTKLHRSRQSATRIFRELEYSGLIVRRKQGLGKPALITLNYPADAKLIAKEGEDVQA